MDGGLTLAALADADEIVSISYAMFGLVLICCIYSAVPRPVAYGNTEEGDVCTNCPVADNVFLFDLGGIGVLRK